MPLAIGPVVLDQVLREAYVIVARWRRRGR
jgi:hypothetical protein